MARPVPESPADSQSCGAFALWGPAASLDCTPAQSCAASMTAGNGIYRFSGVQIVVEGPELAAALRARRVIAGACSSLGRLVPLLTPRRVARVTHGQIAALLRSIIRCALHVRICRSCGVSHAKPFVFKIAVSFSSMRRRGCVTSAPAFRCARDTPCAPTACARCRREPRHRLETVYTVSGPHWGGKPSPPA
jgi:hypothetical protein